MTQNPPRSNLLRQVLLAVTLLSASCVAAPAWSQTSGQTPTVPATVQSDYTLGPEDLLNIIVRDVPDFSGDFLVRLDGTITFPVVGEVAVAGKTASELEKALVKGLDKELKNPQVTVNVKQMRMSRIYILGAVARPSVYDFRKGWRLSELIAAAGGTTQPVEHLKALLFRSGQVTQRIDLRKIFIDADDSLNLPVQQGDVVNVQQDASVRVNVVGEVKNSGVKDIYEGQGAVEAFAAAGGGTPQAALSRSRISRHGQDVPIDLYDAVINGNTKKNVVLEDGDTLIVPQQYARVAVVGMVAHQGSQMMPDGRPWTLSEAISEAGGPVSRAKTDSITLTRAGANGKTETKKFNLKKLGTKDEPDIQLQDKDVVFIPESGRANINDYATIGNLYYLIRAVFVAGL